MPDRLLLTSVPVVRAVTMRFEADDRGSPRAGRESDGGSRAQETSAVDRTASFRQLAEDHLDGAYALATVILGDRGEAEDATHDAIVKAWRAWPSLRSADAFTPWFQRILVNCCRDRLRQRSRRARLDGRPAAQKVDHERPAGDADPYARTAERDAIEGALQGLNPDERIAVALRYFLDLPVDAIATRLGVPIGTVKSRLHRGIDHLRAAYDAAERRSGDEASR
jgi:RNA polymerase sigma-70 factor (ECF subfamily)